MTNQEMRSILDELNKIREAHDRIEILSDTEIKILRQMTDNQGKQLTINEVLEIREYMANRRAWERVWRIVKTIGVSAAATLVAYQVLFDQLSTIIDFIRGSGN